MADRQLAVVTSDVEVFDERRLAMVRDKFANGAPQDEFDLFIEFCRSRNLDPLQRQVYLIPRYDKQNNRKTWSIQTSIDGYRAIADRTGVYAGSDDAVFVEKNGALFTATITVWKFVQGHRCPFTATARWDEYSQDKSPLWSRMGHTMLAKCAESLALRKAFPVQLGGVYTADEMMQAGPVAAPGTRAGEVVDEDTGEIIDVRPEPDDPWTHENARYHAIAAANGWSESARKLLALSQYPYHDGVRATSRKQLTPEELHALGNLMEELGHHVDADTGEIVPAVLTIFANDIAAAPDQETLKVIRTRWQAGRYAAVWINKMWAYRNRHLPAHSASLFDDAQGAPEGPDGEPGADRFTA